MCTLNTVSIRVCMCIHAIYTHIFTRIVILLPPICSAFYDRHIRRYILHTTLSTFDLTSNNVYVKACESQFWRLSVHKRNQEIGFISAKSWRHQFTGTWMDIHGNLWTRRCLISMFIGFLFDLPRVIHWILYTPTKLPKWFRMSQGL